MRSWERAAPALACLTPRDRALLRVLHALRYLTCGQAHRCCYPDLAPASVRARLGELRRRGFLTCLRRGAFADRRIFWGLAPFGRAAAAALAAADGTCAAGTGCADSSPRSAAVAALQLDHLIGTNELFCALCETWRDGSLPPLRWLQGHRAAIDLDHTQVMPDAVILMAGLEDGWWTYYVERDRGTMALPAMREKLERYALLFNMAHAQSSNPEWRVRADAWILFACDRHERAAGLAGLAAAAGVERVWAGLANNCAAGLAASLKGLAVTWPAPSLPRWAAGALAVPAVNPSDNEKEEPL